MGLRALGIGLVCLLVPACSSPSSALGGEASQSEDNFTVASGDRFIVSATNEKIVFAKRVGNARFPYDEQALANKAVFVHPIANKTEDGVFSRVTAVHAEDDTLVVDAQPLTLLEMEGLNEDRIVRIFVDARRPVTNTATNSITAAGVPSLDVPQPFTPTYDSPLFRPSFTSPTVTYQGHIDRASFTPNVLADWSQEGGLELGFRADLDWKSTTTFSGALTGEFYRSGTWESPPLWLTIPVGIVTVPVRASIAVLVQCRANLVAPLQVTLDVSAHASLGGSFRVQPSLEKPPSDWVSGGSWPSLATGSFDVTPTFDTALRGNVTCSLPRIELHTKLFGLAGPILIAMPTAVLTESGISPELRVSAGLEAGIMGLSGSVEVPVFKVRL